MPSENPSPDEITEARRKAIAETIRPISIEELKPLGEGLFPAIDHPWRVTFVDFIKKNADATFHHAVTADRIHFIYCHAQDKGLWFTPGSGVGPLQAKGLKILKEIVEGKK